MASSVLMWVGVLTLVGSAGEPRTFDLLELSARVGCTPSGALVWLFAPAFLMRMAIVPLHTWFVSAQAEVPTAASIVLAGSILPLGGFGAAHLLPRLFGPTLGGAADVLLWLGLLAAAGGGLAAVVQRDLKRLLAYACLAQVGLALAGLVLPSPAAQQGGLMLLLAAGLGGASLFLYGGVVCHARSSQRIADIAGLWRSHPGFSGVAFAGFASVACLPGTVGFVGAWLVLQGMMGAGFVPVAVAASALVVVGGAVLASYRRLCGGAFHEEMWSGERWPRKRQVTSLALLAAAILGAGLLPALFAPPPSELVPSCESRLLDDTLAQADSAGEELP
jgi:NADH:ubiquinone oxidoreductase subunit 4 (subunit M)